ncbi:hypothetical protein K2Z83_20045, partial [Oscillochloris sp. ZM17-4]|uniref:ABC transporter substrate-binding protein n=1 Tax=Oscillochloris sp. ZM17-4 TaxID=2866714 RepID=UPI002108269B
MPRFRLIGMITLALTLVLAGCGGAPAAPAAPATSAPDSPAATSAPAAAATEAPAATGGTLRIGRTAAPDSLNPGAAYITEAFDIFSLVYDTLISTDLRNQPQPQLADEWSVDADGKTWTFKLNPGAKWSDGQPLTSEDVKFTYDMIRGFDSFALISTYTSLIASIETPDPQTVVIAFEQPVANTVERFSSVYILPKHIWETFVDAANPSESTAASEFENTEMIGSGPFTIAEYKAGEFTRLSAVKDYFR